MSQTTELSNAHNAEYGVQIFGSQDFAPSEVEKLSQTEEFELGDERALDAPNGIGDPIEEYMDEEVIPGTPQQDGQEEYYGQDEPLNEDRLQVPEDDARVFDRLTAYTSTEVHSQSPPPRGNGDDREPPELSREETVRAEDNFDTTREDVMDKEQEIIPSSSQLDGQEQEVEYREDATPFRDQDLELKTEDPVGLQQQSRVEIPRHEGRTQTSSRSSPPPPHDTSFQSNVGDNTLVEEVEEEVIPSSSQQDGEEEYYDEEPTMQHDVLGELDERKVEKLLKDSLPKYQALVHPHAPKVVAPPTAVSSQQHGATFSEPTPEEDLEEEQVPSSSQEDENNEERPLQIQENVNKAKGFMTDAGKHDQPRISSSKLPIGSAPELKSHPMVTSNEATSEEDAMDDEEIPGSPEEEAPPASQRRAPPRTEEFMVPVGMHGQFPSSSPVHDVPELPSSSQVPPSSPPAPPVDETVFRVPDPPVKRPAEPMPTHEQPHPKRPLRLQELTANSHSSVRTPFKSPMLKNKASFGPPVAKQKSLSLNSPAAPSTPVINAAARAVRSSGLSASRQFKSPLIKSKAGGSTPSRPTPLALERRLQILKQANKIKQEDSEAQLEALVEKWTKVAREAAEDLFAIVRDAGEVGTGGGGGDGSENDWGYAGKSKGPPKDGWGWEEKKDDETEQMSEEQEGGHGEDEDDEAMEVEKKWDVGTMLASIGIPPESLGWNADEGEFIET